MTGKDDQPGDAAPSTESTGSPQASPEQDLRKRAEEATRGNTARMPESIEALSPEETLRTLHELRVHQIELEMQNEELHRAHAELDASRARYFDLYDLAPVGYCTVSEQGLIIEANLTAAALLGVTRGALVKQPLSRFILEADQWIYYRHRKQLFESGEPQVCELRIVKIDGTAFWARLAATAARDAGGIPMCRVVMSDITGHKQAEAALQQAHDELEQHVAARTEELQQANEELRAEITERKRNEEDLKESEEKYRSLAASVDTMYLVDRDCTYLFINEELRKRYGLPSEAILGRRYGELHSDGDTEAFADCIRKVCKTGMPIMEEHRSERDGRYFLRTFTPIMDRKPGREISKVVVVSKDITQRKHAEKELIETVRHFQETRDMLIQFEKEAAVGRLAVGFAHEILNPASIISSRLQFMEEEPLTDEARESVRICREQLQRIAKISQDLHQSSAVQPRPHVSGDLRDVIELSLRMTESRLREDQVCVVYRRPPAIVPVQMERDGMLKAMVHLILNACDALLNTDQKRLIITVQHPIAAADGSSSVLLVVADNGDGILAGEFDKIFEPFFTRKDPGKGTGLGLSVSKGIIQEHGGTIHAENNDLGGASFIVSLPLDHP